MSMTWLPCVYFLLKFNKDFSAGGFDLCKWFTNSRQLREKIWNRKDRSFDLKTAKKICVNWNLYNEKFMFTFDKIVSLSSTLAITKRNFLEITRVCYLIPHMACRPEKLIIFMCTNLFLYDIKVFFG